MSSSIFNQVVKFVIGLKKRFEKSNLLLTVTITHPFYAFINEDYKLYHVSQLSRFVDLINFERPANEFRVHHAIQSMYLSNVQNKIEKLILCGVLPSKIVMAVHFMGPSFQMESNGQMNFRKSLSYEDICWTKMIQPEGWKENIVNSGLSVHRKNRNFVIVLENSRSIANKVRFTVKRRLGGISPIYIDSDDFSGKCYIDLNPFVDFKFTEGIILNFPNRTDAMFPLMRTIHETIDLTLEEMTQEATIGLPQIITTEATKPTIIQENSSTKATQDTTNEDLQKISSEINNETLIQKSTSQLRNVKVICPVWTPTDLFARNSKFNFDKVNWHLCTHVVIISTDSSDGIHS